jgi:hypothetical protein
MLSIQEMVTKTKDNYKELSETVKAYQEKGIFDYDECNIFGTGTFQQEHDYTEMGREDAKNIVESLREVPLRKLIREFLAKSSSTGIQGAAYLIPLKIYQICAEYASIPDILPEVSMTVIPADQIAGATHQIDIAVEGSYKPKVGSSGAKKPEEEIAYTKATLDFTQPWYINFNIGNDLIEDSQFNLIEQHIRLAGTEMGQYSTTAVLAVMASTNDGDGTLNGVAGGSDTTTLTSIANAITAVEIDQFTPDRLLCCDHVMMDALIGDTTVAPYAQSYHDAGVKLQPQMPILGLQWIRCNSSSLWTAGTHNSSTETNFPTNALSYVFCKNYSYISGRKRWLRIENYSDPVRDLVGAVISARQDTVSVYDDSVCKITEG